MLKIKLTTDAALLFIRIIATSIGTGTQNSSWSASAIPASNRTVFFTNSVEPELLFALRLRFVTAVATVQDGVTKRVLRNTRSVKTFESISRTFLIQNIEITPILLSETKNSERKIFEPLSSSTWHPASSDPSMQCWIPSQINMPDMQRLPQGKEPVGHGRWWQSSSEASSQSAWPLQVSDRLIHCPVDRH